MIQDSFKVEAKVMETSDPMAEECKIFTHEFLGFRSTEDMDMKLKSNKSYISMTVSSKSENMLHTNLIQDSFNIEAKVMETSDLMAGPCKLFTHEFIEFRATDHKDMKLQGNTSYMVFQTSSNS